MYLCVVPPHASNAWALKITAKRNRIMQQLLK
jgi:hypothetical protein